jgi:hypothetical protein
MWVLAEAMTMSFEHNFGATQHIRRTALNGMSYWPPVFKFAIKQRPSWQQFHWLEHDSV